LRTFIFRFDICLFFWGRWDLVILFLQSNYILLFLFLGFWLIFRRSFNLRSLFYRQVNLFFLLSFFLCALRKERCHDISGLLRHWFFLLDWLLYWLFLWCFLLHHLLLLWCFLLHWSPHLLWSFHLLNRFFHCFLLGLLWLT